MAFLTLMGFTIPTSASSNGTIEPVRAGEYGRSFGLKPYSAVRAESMDYRGSTPFQDRRTSQAHRMLLSGAGEAFAFNAAGSGASSDYYSTKGLAPILITTPETFATGGPVSNGGRLVLGLDDYIRWVFPAGPLDQASLSIWLKCASGTSGVWKHYLLESGSSGTVSAAWQNGASIAVGALPAELDISLTHDASEVAVFLGNGIEAAEYAEVIALPYRASLLRSDWATYMHNAGSGRAVEDLPYLSMGGTWVPPGDSTQTDVVLGEVMGTRMMDTVVGGTTIQYEAFDFMLRSRNVR